VVSTSVSMACMVLCGPAWLCSSPTSSIQSLLSASCLVSVMEFPRQRASRGKAVPSCQLHLSKITLEPARLPSVPPERVQSAPPQMGGAERHREKEETSISFSPWLGSTWLQAATHAVVGRLVLILWNYRSL
jgi:hypothetical protein